MTPAEAPLISFPANPAFMLKLDLSFAANAIPTDLLKSWLLLLWHPTQNTLSKLLGYPTFLFASESRQDRHLAAIGRVIELFARHSDRPPREIQFPLFIELFSFNRLCGYLGVPIATPFVETVDGARSLYRFCNYYWLPVRRKDVCLYHSTSFTTSGAEPIQPICAHLSVKQALEACL